MTMTKNIIKKTEVTIDNRGQEDSLPTSKYSFTGVKLLYGLVNCYCERPFLTEKPFY